ncbi:hypothetical protein GQ457_12G011390 [Hibiscus cannabinus]
MSRWLVDRSLTLWRQEGKKDQGITFVQVRFYGYGSMYKQWGGSVFCILGLEYRYSSGVSVPKFLNGTRVSVLAFEYRWNSTYTMLKVAKKFECAFDSYARDDHSFFLDLIAGDGVPTFDDWENVRRIVKILEPFYDLTLKVSGSLHVTFHLFFETLMDIHSLLDGWANCGDLDIIYMA